MSIISKLKKFGRGVTKDHPNLNFGGCGVYAYILGEHLKKMGFEVKCFATQEELLFDSLTYKKFILSNRQGMSIWDWENYGVDFNHIGLAVKVEKYWYLHDANITKRFYKTTKEFDGEYLLPEFFEVDVIKKIASKPYGWNPQFNRNEIPLIKKKVKEF